MKGLTEDLMFNAVLKNDSRYDGVFYYAVRTTGIVCRPSCKSKAPVRKNVLFFFSLDDSIKAGFRPCKRCRPDLGTDYAPPREAIKTAFALMNTEFHNPQLLKELPRQIALSPSYFQRLFKNLLGQTPAACLQQIRLNEARRLLAHSSMSNTEICFAIGFTSLSGFYAAFRKEMGQAPSEYRRFITKEGGL